MWNLKWIYFSACGFLCKSLDLKLEKQYLFIKFFNCSERMYALISLANQNKSSCPFHQHSVLSAGCYQRKILNCLLGKKQKENKKTTKTSVVEDLSWRTTYTILIVAASPDRLNFILRPSQPLSNFLFWRPWLGPQQRCFEWIVL